MSKLIFLFFLSFAFTQQALSSEVFPGRTEDFPPYSYAEGTAVKGFSVELMKAVFDRAKLKTEIKVWPWNRAYEAAQKSKNNYVFSTSRTPEREKSFKWVGPIATDSVFLASLGSSELAPHKDFKTFSKYKVLGYANDLPVQLLQKNGFEVIVPSSEQTRFDMFKNGRVPLDIPTSSSIELNEKTYNFKYKILAHLYNTQYWAAFNPNTDDATIKKLNTALKEFQGTPEHAELIKKYKLDKK